MTSDHKQELVNSLTHGMAATLSVAGCAVLVVFASLRGTVWHVVSYSVYGLTLVLLFTASTLYHATRHPEIKRILRVLDHAAIFLLIAGTYTPFTLTALRGPWGWTIFGLVWTIALAGVGLKIWRTGRHEKLSVALYLGMGWLVLVAMKPLLQSVSGPGIFWLASGGIFYSLGVVFYAMKNMPYHHAVWHVFVFMGSCCHYVAILCCLL